MKQSSKKRLVLLDAHAIIHRAYHALPEFATAAGVPTGALYGLITMILRITQDLKPDYVVACYDLPQKTFRHEAYDAYKGTRTKTDDNLVSQIEQSREIMEALSIPIYDAPGFEADDILGTIVEELKVNKDVDIIIASGDMDTLQLVDGTRVKVYTLRKGITDTVLYDEPAVHARFGFGPEHVPDFKGLRGDASDNIIGIAGIGEKTATDLVSKFGTIESLYETLKKDESILLLAGIKSRMVELLKNNEEEALFSKTLATIRRDAPIEFHLPEKTLKESFSLQAFEEICRKFEFRTLPARARTLFSLESSDASEEVKKEHESVDLKLFEEAKIALWLLNSDLTHPTLEDIFSYTKTRSFDDAYASLRKELEHNNLEKVFDEIERPIIPIIRRMMDHGIKIDIDFLKEISAEYHSALEDIEKKIYDAAGQKFNINSPKQLGNILFDVLGLSAKGMKKTAGGERSTRESELEKLADQNPIVGFVLEYRELGKLLSTYIDVLPKLVDAKHRLHAEFLQAGTSTGRFSSQNPNLQNIPINGPRGSRIRKAFIASPGYVLGAFDYSQIELRVAAILSNDPVFTEIFISGRDVHASVASKVFHVDEDAVTQEMRRNAKVINFGILYGMGITSLQKNLGTTRAEAQEFSNEYFRQFKGLEEYLEETTMFAKKHGYTETLFGRRRYFPALKSPLPYIRAQAERMAINAPVQGTATADIIKLAIAHIEKRLAEEKLLDKVYLVLQIHDELVYEIEKSVADRASEVIQDEMKHVLERSFLHFHTDVPLEVHAGLGNSWGDIK